MRRPSELSSLLPTLFTAKPLGKRLREAVIWRVWDRAVGEQIASKARPAAFREGVLTVVVSSAPWMQQLGFFKRQMIEAVNRDLGEELVRDIYLKAGSVSAPTESPQPVKPSRRELTSQERERIQQDAASIADDDLRIAFVNFQTAYLRNIR
jgi:predicted nucleic acid-binding Zn ribbon protein